MASQPAHTWTLTLPPWPTPSTSLSVVNLTFRHNTWKHWLISSSAILPIIKFSYFCLWNISHIYPFLSRPISNILECASTSHSVEKLVDRGKGWIKTSDNSKWRPILEGEAYIWTQSCVLLHYFDLILSQYINFKIINNIKENVKLLSFQMKEGGWWSSRGGEAYFLQRTIWIFIIICGHIKLST